jgi:ABC-type uncharacterized transport system permease subunit
MKIFIAICGRFFAFISGALLATEITTDFYAKTFSIGHMFIGILCLILSMISILVDIENR